MDRLTETNWRNLDPWECCGQDRYCQRGCHDIGGCTKGCIVPLIYRKLAAYEDRGLEPEDIKQLQKNIIEMTKEALDGMISKLNKALGEDGKNENKM